MALGGRIRAAHARKSGVSSLDQDRTHSTSAPPPCCMLLCMLLSTQTSMPLLQSDTSDPSNNLLHVAHNRVCVYVRVSTHALQSSTRTVVPVSQSSATLLPAACCSASSPSPHARTQAWK